MSHFWSSTDRGYIEPKRPYQLIGIIDFIQPFLIQRMDKPKTTPSTTTVTKILKNGTIKTENHYKTGYRLNSITIEAIDSYEDFPNSDLNKADKLYRILTDGGYTLNSNEIGPAREQLRFPAFRILELLPQPKTSQKAAVNAVASGIGNAAEAAIGGGGLAGILDSALDAASTAFEFLNPQVAGVYTMQDPVITDVDFGTGLNYEGDGLIKISLTIDYNNFKYEKSLT